MDYCLCSVVKNIPLSNRLFLLDKIVPNLVLSCHGKLVIDIESSWMEFIKIIPVFFYAEDSGKEPVRVWLQELSSEDRKIIGRNIREVQMDWPVGSPLVKSLG